MVLLLDALEWSFTTNIVGYTLLHGEYAVHCWGDSRWQCPLLDLRNNGA